MDRRRTLLVAVSIAVVLGPALWLVWPRAAPPPSVLTGVTSGHRVTLTVDRPWAGSSPVTVQVTDPRGSPATLTSVTVSPVMTRMGHAYEPVNAAAVGPGRYRAERVSLPMAGQYELDVRLEGKAGIEQAVFSLLVAG